VVAHGGESNLGPFLSPPLTAAETDMAEFGSQVAAMLAEYLDKPDEVIPSVRIAPKLVVRETTQAVRVLQMA